MRKRKQNRRLSRKKSQRKALLRTLGNSLILKEKIRTTQAKAKELKRFIEKAITRAKKGGLIDRRLLARDFTQKMVKKLVNEFGLRYKTRQGGYSRIVKLGPRKTDGAEMAIIELVK